MRANGTRIVPLLAILLGVLSACSSDSSGGSSGEEEQTTDVGQSESSDESNTEGAGCTNTCRYANDEACDDGGPGSSFSVCELGTDCNDCGARGNGTGETTVESTTACVTTLTMYQDTAHTVFHSTERYCDEFGLDCESGSGNYTEYTDEQFVGETCASQGYPEHCTSNGLWYPSGEGCSTSSGCDYARCISTGNTPAYCQRCLD